jgi:hypothetical protein
MSAQGSQCEEQPETCRYWCAGKYTCSDELFLTAGMEDDICVGPDDCKVYEAKE